MIKVIKPDFEFQDERGFLLQLVHEGFRQFNIIFQTGCFSGRSLPSREYGSVLCDQRLL